MTMPLKIYLSLIPGDGDAATAFHGLADGQGHGQGAEAVLAAGHRIYTVPDGVAKRARRALVDRFIPVRQFTLTIGGA